MASVQDESPNVEDRHRSVAGDDQIDLAAGIARDP